MKQAIIIPDCAQTKSRSASRANVFKITFKDYPELTQALACGSKSKGTPGPLTR
jgi:hypothetical protein